MNELFLKIINMSISASWLVLAVLVLRFVLKKLMMFIFLPFLCVKRYMHGRAQTYR